MLNCAIVKMVCPFFSIIIPVYNSENTIHETLTSVLEQTFGNFEILVIDALSSDKTVNVLESVQDNRVRITSEPDEGIYDAMNKGIKASQGQWLYFIGSGDTLFDKEVLADVAGELQVRDDAELIYGDVKVNGDTGWARAGTLYDGEFDLKKLLERNICHQSIFYRRDVFNKVGNYNLNYPVCSDYDLNLRCFSKQQCIYYQRTIAYFNAGGISTDGNDIRFNADFPENVFKYYHDRLFRKEFRRFKKFFIAYGKQAMRDKDYSLFFKMLLLRLWHIL